MRLQSRTFSTFSRFPFPFQFDRTKKPAGQVSDETKSSQNESTKDSTSTCPAVPNRSAKPALNSNTSLSQEEQSQIHSEAVAVMKKARHEQETRNQLRRLEEEQREKELKERREREKQERREREEEEKGHQERKRLERQKAEEEEEDKENRGERARRGKEHNSDTPTKSVSLDSPAPNHIVSEIKVSLWFPLTLTATNSYTTSFKDIESIIGVICHRGSLSPEPGVKRWAGVSLVCLMVG